MFDMSREQLVSIDYGCIFNTATFDYPLSQLTSTDTILWSDLFRHLLQSTNKQAVLSMANRLKADYDECLQQSRSAATELTDEMPQEWQVPAETVSKKLSQLFDDKWTVDVWDHLYAH